MGVQELLDLPRVEVLAAADDHVLDPSDDVHVPVVARGGAEPDAEAVAEFCQGRIARHKIPRYVRCVDEFPLTVTGKVQKFKLREQAIGDLGLVEVQTA
ncbi:MAG: AMP-binding enzyme [Nocardioidaceae bacterium]